MQSYLDDMREIVTDQSKFLTDGSHSIPHDFAVKQLFKELPRLERLSVSHKSEGGVEGIEDETTRDEVNPEQLSIRCSYLAFSYLAPKYESEEYLT